MDLSNFDDFSDIELIDEVLRVYDESKHLVEFDSEILPVLLEALDRV